MAISGSLLIGLLERAKSSYLTHVDVAFTMASGLSSIFPDFDSSDSLTPYSIIRLALVTQVQGCSSVLSQIVDSSVAHCNWSQSFYAKAFKNLTANGGQPVAGPLLILQGGNDTIMLPDLVTNALNKTRDAHPDSPTGVRHLRRRQSCAGYVCFSAHMARLVGATLCE